MTERDLDMLPVKAKLLAMDRPYQPGRTLRRVLVGAVVVAAAAGVFLLLMPAPVGPRPRPPAPPVQFPPTPGVVYQNLRNKPADVTPRAAPAAPQESGGGKESKP